jgi:hypothetical protein
VNALTTVLGEPFLSESAPTAILIVNADCAACRAYKETYAGIQADAERTGMEFRLVVTNDLPKTLDFAPEGVGPRISDPTGHVYRLLDHWFVPSLAIVEGETISLLHTPFNEDWPPPGAFAPSD